MFSRHGSTRYLTLFTLVWALMVIPDANIQAQMAGVHFKWTLAALVNPETDRQLISIDRYTELHTGDQLKFYLERINPSYIYLFHISPKGDLAMLFPAKGKYTDTPTTGKHFIPPGRDWFVLDNATGKEKFFLIAASWQIEELEARFANHLRTTDPDAISDSTANILAEIKKLRQQHQTLAIPAEKPMRLGGNFRGSENGSPKIASEIINNAREVTTEEFFSRTITIDHR